MSDRALQREKKVETSERTSEKSECVSLMYIYIRYIYTIQIYI